MRLAMNVELKDTAATSPIAISSIVLGARRSIIIVATSARCDVPGDSSIYSLYHRIMLPVFA